MRDVYGKTAMKTIGVTLCCMLAAAIALASPSPVLIPTMYSGPGAFGSRWSTTVLLNNHERTALTSPGVTFWTFGCPIPEGCLTNDIPPGEFGFIDAPRAANGLLLYLPSVDAQIAFMARLAAAPRHTGTGGTELPVVREREFATGPVRLPFVTLYEFQHPLRTTLRIYAPDAQPGTSVTVELRSWTTPDGPPQFSKQVVLTVPEQPVTPPVFPGYAQLILQDAFPSAVQAGGWNVTVVPLPFDSTTTPRIWAFLTMTDNVTQEVTVQRPQ